MKRLILFILIFAIFLAFIVLNLESKSDIFLGFTRFYDIPVFLSVLFAFVLGMLVAIPFVFSMGRGRDKKEKQEKPEKPEKQEKRKQGKFLSRKKNKEIKDEPVPVISLNDEVTKEKSLYGID